MNNGTAKHILYHGTSFLLKRYLCFSWKGFYMQFSKSEENPNIYVYTFVIDNYVLIFAILYGQNMNSIYFS